MSTDKHRKMHERAGGVEQAGFPGSGRKRVRVHLGRVPWSDTEARVLVSGCSENIEETMHDVTPEIYQSALGKRITECSPAADRIETLAKSWDRWACCGTIFRVFPKKMKIT